MAGHIFREDGYKFKKNLFNKMADITKLDVDAKEIAEEIRESLVTTRWPEQLVDYLFSVIGDVVFVDSVKIEIQGEMQFCIDMIAPIRKTTMLYAFRHVCSAMYAYVQKELGPVPPTWDVVKGDVRVPIDEILHFRVKTNSPCNSPTEKQTHEGTVEMKGSKFPAPSTQKEVSFEEAIPFIDDPQACFVAFSGRYTRNFINLRQAIGAVTKVSKTRGDKKIESADVFFNSICARFPNYYGVLLDMGWEDEEIPIDKEELPEKFLDAYKRAELRTNAFLQERLFRSAKNSSSAKEISGVLKTMDPETIGKKEEVRNNAKKKRLPADIDIDSPSWV